MSQMSTTGSGWRPRIAPWGPSVSKRRLLRRLAGNTERHTCPDSEPVRPSSCVTGTPRKRQFRGENAHFPIAIGRRVNSVRTGRGSRFHSGLPVIVGTRGSPGSNDQLMRAVVVGASSGLGRSIATGLGRRGATVALLARRLERLVDAAREAGPGSLAVACDVTDEESCRAAIEEAAHSLGGIDALVYATGIGPLGNLVDITAETWRRTFDTNVIGAALVTAAAIPHLTETRGCRGIPLVGQRLVHPALARTRGLRHQQSSARHVGGGLAGRTSGRRIHPCHRRGLRRRRGGVGYRVHQRMGLERCRAIASDLGGAELSVWIPHGCGRAGPGRRHGSTVRG